MKCALVISVCLLAIPPHDSATTFEAWRDAHFTSAQISEPTISGEKADPDHDGLVNLLEYAYHSDPWLSEGDHQLVAGFEITDEEEHLTLTHRRLQNASDLFMALQGSADLRNWSILKSVSVNTTPASPGYDLVTLRDPQIAQPAVSRFLRLAVAIDSDQDGLPDDWEMQYFGTLDYLSDSDAVASTAYSRSLLLGENAAVARMILGLGDAATRAVGISQGTVAAGDRVESILNQAKYLDPGLPAVNREILANFSGVQPTQDLWFCTTFNGPGGSEDIVLQTSRNGKDFTAIATVPPPEACRDTCHIWKDDALYAFSTAGEAFGGVPYYWIHKTKDLINWTLVAKVELNPITFAGFNWGPKPFIDDNGDVYVVFSNDNNGTGAFKVWWQKATSADLTTWTTPTALALPNTNLIDEMIFKADGAYYLAGRLYEGHGGPILFKSTTSPVSGYTLYNYNPGGISVAEAQWMTVVDPGHWRLFMNSQASPFGLFYIESKDSGATWGNRVNIIEDVATANQCVTYFPKRQNLASLLHPATAAHANQAALLDHTYKTAFFENQYFSNGETKFVDIPLAQFVENDGNQIALEVTLSARAPSDAPTFFQWDYLITHTVVNTSAAVLKQYTSSSEAANPGYIFTFTYPDSNTLRISATIGGSATTSRCFAFVSGHKFNN